jgi:hypothetical protein
MAVETEGGPRWRSALLPVTAIVVGLAAGLAGGLYATLAAGFKECEGSPVFEPTDAWFCEAPFRHLLGPVEVALALIVLFAPITGGSVSAADGRWLWLVIGMLVAAFCLLLQLILSEGQTPVLS